MEILLLTEQLELNYYALQRFLNNEPLQGPRNRRCCNKGQQKQRSKLRRLKAQNFRCKDCNCKFRPDQQGRYPTATSDHVIPWRYGSNLEMNMEFVCDPCNQARENNRLQVILNFFGTIDCT